MGLFTHTRDRVALRRKRSRFRKNPTPGAFCELVQCYLRFEDYEAAYRHALWGVERFPESDIVRELLRIAQRAVAANRIGDINKELKEKPSPDGYTRLARYALQVSDGATAIAAYRDCIQRFPTFAAAHSALAQLLERRFLRDLSFADGREVVQLLRKASKLDPSDRTAALRLASFYARIGAEASARTTAREILEIVPGNVEAGELLEILGPGPEVSEEEDIFDILRGIEEEARLPGDDQDRRRMRREVLRMRAGLRSVMAEIGAHRAAVVDADGDAWDDAGNVSTDALVTITTNLSRTAHVTTRRSGLGALRGVTLESSGGALVLRRGQRSTVSCLLPAGTSILGTQECLGRLVSSGAQEHVQP